MMRQTVLKFKGDLGMIGLKSHENESGGDSSNVSTSDFSDEDLIDAKQSYTLTGVLVPDGQAISEITVTWLSMKEIGDYVEKYKKTTRKLALFFRIFDSKDIVSKKD